ncbi:MAG: hypothetical protein IPL20_03140 [Saprospiraceae bacterium]|nr:hypothetical protein [Saprospiraceae bacterium]
MLPILVTYLTLLGKNVDAFDKYFETRLLLLSAELNKLQTANNAKKIVWESTNIRQTVCGLMCLLFTDKVDYVIDHNNSIFRGYEKSFINEIEK